MGTSTRIYRQNREDKYNKWELEDSKRERAIAKIIAKENRKTDPKCIREDKAMALTQGIYVDQKANYEILYEKISTRADELYNLIISDLGLDRDENVKLSVSDIIEVFEYYKNKGLNQIKNAISDDMIKNYFPHNISPYQKLFKKLIIKRAEFLIVAPIDRLSLNSPYKKIKDEEMKVALVKHLADLKIIQSYKFAEKFPALRKLYEEMNENEVGI